MEEKIKEILSVFLKIPKEQIVSSTIIDRTAVSSSILLHRMYAKLATEGIEVKDYQDVKIFGDLLQKISANKNALTVTVSPERIINENAMSVAADLQTSTTGVGIDIELISAMPRTNDFREDSFYIMNFSSSEIAYCILQPEPYASFGGLFAAKEAIVKADNTYKARPFNSILIQHTPMGKPFHPAFSISISHTADMAVALALPVRENNHVLADVINTQMGKAGQYSKSVSVWVLLLISLLLSATALFLIIRK